uniref:Hyaluronidase n=1 Tax=Elaeophora elaphi TaxID=1147741 RepID=A0A0R3RP43_9BILA
EKWRPLYEHNWASKKIYQDQSIKYAKKQKKNNLKVSKWIAQYAKNEFNNKSKFNGSSKRRATHFREFLIATIREAKKLRPNALWGYYGMPFCNYNAGKKGIIGCGKDFEEFNNKLISLYQESKALYPSVYFPIKGETYKPNNMTGCLYITFVLKETKRCVERLKKNVPIYTFTGFEYFQVKPPYPYYSLVN